VIIFGIDVTSESGSLAIRANGQTVAELALVSQDGFAHVLFGATNELLKRAQLTLDDIDCFASASGPGAFTGVRVGLSAVKGLAEAMGKPAAGISNLRALATFGASDRRAVVMDARRGEVFGAVYNAALEPVAPELVSTFCQWLDSLSSPPCEFITPAGSPFCAALEGTRLRGTRCIEAPRHLAPAIAFCAELDGRSGRWSDPAALEANYVRRSDAELLFGAHRRTPVLP